MSKLKLSVDKGKTCFLGSENPELSQKGPMESEVKVEEADPTVVKRRVSTRRIPKRKAVPSEAEKIILDDDDDEVPLASKAKVPRTGSSQFPGEVPSRFGTGFASFSKEQTMADQAVLVEKLTAAIDTALAPVLSKLSDLEAKVDNLFMQVQQGHEELSVCIEEVKISVQDQINAAMEEVTISAPSSPIT